MKARAADASRPAVARCGRARVSRVCPGSPRCLFTGTYIMFRNVSAGCVSHTSVHSDCDSRAWGSGVCARVVLDGVKCSSQVYT